MCLSLCSVVYLRQFRMYGGGLILLGVPGTNVDGSYIKISKIQRSGDVTKESM